MTKTNCYNLNLLRQKLLAAAKSLDDPSSLTLADIDRICATVSAAQSDVCNIRSEMTPRDPYSAFDDLLLTDEDLGIKKEVPDLSTECGRDRVVELEALRQEEERAYNRRYPSEIIWDFD